MCEVLGTGGNTDVQLSSLASAFAAAFLLEERSVDFLLSVFASDRGDTLTSAGMVGEPLFGGAGGLDEECRR